MKLLPFLLLFISTLGYAQHSGTITIKKQKPDTVKTDTIKAERPPVRRPVRLSGLFVSDWVADEIRTGNSVSLKQTRYYFYYTGAREVYMFRSAGNPKKVLKGLRKNPGKYAEEVGRYELDNGDLYIETHALHGNLVYRYTGEANPSKMWLGMKAQYHKKVQLDLYLSKYNE